MIPELKRGDLVRVRKGRKVFVVSNVYPPCGYREHSLFKIDAPTSFNHRKAAQHPDAAKRVADAFATYTRDDLTLVEP